MTTEELEELAAQLRLPNGAHGIAVSEMMNETNITMTRHSVSGLGLSAGEHILEVGHGNGAHIPYIMAQAEQLHYTGLELSALMHSEAQRINTMIKDNTYFFLYEGTVFPFADGSFDKAFSVNTLYFWIDPMQTLMEFYRVLKPGSILCITYGEEEFMAQLPFTKFGFTLYSLDKVYKLVHDSPFKILAAQSETELIKSKTGDMVERKFTTIRLHK